MKQRQANKKELEYQKTFVGSAVHYGGEFELGIDS